jgi:hypothetical protein
MSRTVDTSSTFEDWRQKYNDLANDVGGLTNLRTAEKASLVDAVNYIQDQYFFFQDFDYDGSDGATSNTVFSGADNGSNVLQYSAGKLLVFKNGTLLRSGTDYTATNGTSVVLGSSANNGDVIRISSFTGSYEGVGGAGASSGASDWQLAGGVLFNKNTDGIIFNADSSINQSLEHSNSFQFENVAYFKDEIYMKSVGTAPTGINFQDGDNSHRVQLKAPTTISTNFSLILPTADGSSGQFLRTDGSGQLSFGTVSSTAPDITISANNSANETVFLTFVDGATGTQGLESDTGLTYNPSTGMLTTAGFTGALTGNASTATTLATNRNFSITGDITASAVAFNGSGVVTLSATLDDNTVDSAELVDGSIDTSHIANSQITVAKMAANSVDSAQYVDGSIDTAHYADNSITGAELADNIDIAGTFDVTGATTLDNTLSVGEAATFTEAVIASKSARITQVAITSGSGAVAWDANAAANAYHTTTENTTFAAPGNAVEGAVISVEIAQGGTPRTIAWNTVFEFAASTAPTVTATANKTDIFTFRYNGSVWQEIGRVQNMAQT